MQTCGTKPGKPSSNRRDWATGRAWEVSVARSPALQAETRGETQLLVSDSKSRAKHATEMTLKFAVSIW